MNKEDERIRYEREKERRRRMVMDNVKKDLSLYKEERD
jgi:hypothetical protein